ncbi:MAG TPA: tRNA pseudouridine(55) synthase TruB [Desulfurivibrionaceae bacterium]|nr:tRNA pseudouridine(55) synthase TruB [Desulfurivibrionaceae bacterium]
MTLLLPPEPPEIGLPGLAEAGIYLLDKPEGPSSFRMVHVVRRALGIKKTGHAGTLDPFATGLLIVCAGRPATRLISQLMAGEKEYLATLTLGVETTTQDREGEVVATAPFTGISAAQVADCLAGFVGEQLQLPPLYSALKHQGKPLYHYARRGVEIERQPRPVTISELECRGFAGDSLKIRVRCGKGTYIRALAFDIGRVLGCGAHLAALRRIRSGPFSVAEAVEGNALFGDLTLARELLLEKGLTIGAALAKI